MSVSDAGLVFQPPAAGTAAVPILVVSSLYIISLIAGSSTIAELMRAQNQDARRHLLLQAWQLRQLVPQTR